MFWYPLPAVSLQESKASFHFKHDCLNCCLSKAECVDSRMTGLDGLMPFELSGWWLAGGWCCTTHNQNSALTLWMVVCVCVYVIGSLTRSFAHLCIQPLTRSLHHPLTSFPVVFVLARPPLHCWLTHSLIRSLTHFFFVDRARHLYWDHAQAIMHCCCCKRCTSSFLLLPLFTEWNVAIADYLV